MWRRLSLVLCCPAKVTPQRILKEHKIQAKEKNRMKRNRREVSKNGRGKKNYETSKKRADNVDEKRRERKRIAEEKWKRKK